MHLLRTKEAVDFLNAKCPSISTTRWLYIVDILLFMMINKNDINSFIEIQNQANGTYYNKKDKNYDFIYKVLILLKLFSLIVEKYDFKFLIIVPFVREFFSQIEKLYSVTINDTFKQIIDNLDFL